MRTLAEVLALQDTDQKIYPKDILLEEGSQDRPSRCGETLQ